MRTLLLVLAVTFVLAGPAFADGGGGDPPVVTIYDMTCIEITSLMVDPDEQFTLIGVAVGDVPLYYNWYEGELIATGNVLADFSFSEPGEYTIVLEVVDCNGLKGSDSVLVIVGGAVPTKLSTWGQIKALFR